MTTVVVDTGLGNLRSVEKAVAHAADAAGKSAEVVRSASPELIAKADRIVVPGQGGFRDAARAFRGGLGEAVLESIRAGKPYLGICLGLQILFDESEEAPGERGLGFIPGKVRRLDSSDGIKIPHMGWNQLELRSGGHPCLSAAGGGGAWVYFVHSFHAVPKDSSCIKSIVTYGANAITAAVGLENVLATQFHPEKSQQAGLRLLEKFLDL